MTLEGTEGEVYFYRMGSLTSDKNKPGCYMTFTDQEGLRFPGNTHIGRSTNVLCKVFRNDEEIGFLRTNPVRNEFTDHDVVPGKTYTYEIRGYDGKHCSTTGKRDIVCYFIYSVELESQVVAFGANGDTRKAISYSLYKQTAEGKTPISGCVSYICDDDWINVEVAMGVLNIDVAPNETGSVRIGTVTIGYEGFKWSIKVIQGTSDSLVTVTSNNGSEISIPQSWFLEKCATMLVANGGDYATTAHSKAANNLKVWECYVTGTDPTDKNNLFRTIITFDVVGKPVISYSPKLSTKETAERTYRKFGKVKLNDEVWTEITDGNEYNYNFFKVTVEMK